MLSDNKLLQDDDITREEEGLVFNPYNPDNVEITLNQSSIYSNEIWCSR